MRALHFAPLVFLCFCESNQVPAAARTFDLGDGTTATFAGDGSLLVTRDGAPLLASPGLVSRSLDSDSPDAWHDPAKASYAFEGIDPRTVDVESPAPGVLHVTTHDDGSPTALVRVTLASDDGFYTGLGERFGHVSARGQIVPMQLEIDAKFESATNDAHVPVPLLVSSKGYGVFVESRESGAFDVASTDAGKVTATFEGKAESVWFFFARDPLDVVAEYTQHVGLPRVLPRWALGPFYWRNTWDSQAQMIDDAVMMRNLHIPTTTMWIDNPWQTSYDTSVPDPARFPDPPTLMGELAALGYRVMFWSEPYLEKPGTGPDDEARQLYAQAAAQPDVLVHLKDGSILAALGSDDKLQFGMIDFSTAAGRDFWASLVSRAVALGASGFKLDYGEDIVPSFFNARLGVVFADGETDRTARTYPLGYHMAYHQALDAVRSDGFLLVRASSWGGASITNAIWPGDLDNDFRNTATTTAAAPSSSAASRRRSSPRRRSRSAASRASAPTPAASATARRRKKRSSAGPSTPRSRSSCSSAAEGILTRRGRTTERRCRSTETSPACTLGSSRTFRPSCARRRRRARRRSVRCRWRSRAIRARRRSPTTSTCSAPICSSRRSRRRARAIAWCISRPATGRASR